MVNCLSDLQNDNTVTYKKAQITKGLILAIKHQIDNEFFPSNNTLKLKGIVDEILNRKVLINIDNSKALKEFQEYANKKPSIVIPEMLKKINEAVADKKWLNKEKTSAKKHGH